jgi:hypothetical protein
MKTREDILEQACIECLTEMYAKAQPPLDFKQYYEDVKSGKISKEDKVYEYHYLSSAEINYIVNKYVDIYAIDTQWIDHTGLIFKYLKEGGIRVTYQDNKKEYVNQDPLKDVVKQVLINHDVLDTELLDDLVNSVFNIISNCKSFYKLDKEVQTFKNTIYLGVSPCSNKESVIQYWLNKGVNITIEDRNPLLLWEMDYYGKEFEEVMIGEYGENWKEFWDQKLKDSEYHEY